MNTYRKTAVAVGVLYIIGTVAGILSAVVAGPIVVEPANLDGVSANQTQVIVGALLVMTMGLALAIVPAVLLPLLRQFSEPLAQGYLLLRGGLEAMLYLLIAIGWLVQVTLSREFAVADGAGAGQLQALGTVISDAGAWTGHVLSIVFSLGGLILYSVLFRSRLVPRWLAGWGLVGAVLYLGAPLLAMFGIELGILFAPLAVQEMAMAIWLIAHGFNSSALELVSPVQRPSGVLASNPAT